MEIRLPKPDIKCVQCGQRINNFVIDGRTESNIEIYSNCSNCGHDIFIDVIFEEDPILCNCDLCKKLNIDKDNK